MTIELNSLSQEQLLYLKQKWSAEIHEIDLDSKRASDRLTSRLDRRANTAEELAAISSQLSTAQTLLEHLNNTSAPAELITDQETLVAELQASFDAASIGSGTLTDGEAVLQQVSIDELALRKTYREGKIAEVDALLNN